MAAHGWRVTRSAWTCSKTYRREPEEATYRSLDDAFAHTLYTRRPEVVNVWGHRWKCYPNGRLLCADTMPMHKPLLGARECDCATREGETIATFTLPLSDKEGA